MGKSPKMTQALDQISKGLFGRSRSECLERRVCPICGGPADTFHDSLSRKENKISGMCQKCQDEIFGGPDDK